LNVNAQFYSIEGTWKSNSGYTYYVKYSWNNKEELKITLTKSKLTQIRQGFGKQLLFSTDSLMKPEKIIDYYHDNWKMNQDHRILKMPDTISFHPMWVWTDSKNTHPEHDKYLGITVVPSFG